MTGAAFAARAVLWEWASELEDPDPEQRSWKLRYVEGILDACASVGVLGADELVAWRALLAGAAPAGAGGDRAAAARHLEALLADVVPLSREPAPAARAASRRFSAALAALLAAGVLDDGEERVWRERLLAAEAPWLDERDRSRIGGLDGFYAIAVPAATPEEAAADAEEELRLERLLRRGEARRVFLATRVERRDGLAVVAAVARDEAVDLHFHHLGGARSAGFDELEAFHEATAALSAPELRDDAGTVYEAVIAQPVASHGAAGPVDPPRPRALAGVWRYQPAAPAGVRAFTARRDGASWALA